MKIFNYSKYNDVKWDNEILKQEQIFCLKKIKSNFIGS